MNIGKLTYGFILLFINPIAGAFASIKSFKLPESSLILVFFFGFYGMTMVIDESKDAYVHVQSFQSSYVNKTLDTFLAETKNILLLKPGENEGDTNDDLYLHVMSFIVSIFTKNPSGLYFIIAFIYGYFYIRGIKKVFSLISEKRNLILSFLFFVFIFWKSLEGINSIRNWTAAWVFFNGAFSYLQTKKIKYIFLIFCAPLIHFAYALITIPFFIFLILGNRPIFYGIILIGSFFYSFENISFIIEFLSATDLGESKIGYIKEGSSENYLNERGAEAFHAKFYLVASKIFVSTLFYYTLIFYKYFLKKEQSYLLSGLASIGLLLIAISNLTTFSISINTRVYINAGLYSLTYIILVYNNNSLLKIKDSKKFGFDFLAIIGIPFASLFLITQWSQIGDFTDIRIFLSPLLYPFFGDEAFALKEALRNFFN